MAAGEAGEGSRMAMRILTRMAGVLGAERLLDITSAHIDGCLYHGYSGLEFAERLVEGEARVRVPTTLNVGALDLLHPDRFQGSEQVREWGGRLMAAYEEMGCRPTWTCAPYQLPEVRPAVGEQVAWAESNAIVFANSVFGARTNRYGDFIDICAAIAGRVPAAGLHLTENRRGQVVFDLRRLPRRLVAAETFYPVLGYHVGERCRTRIPVLVGLPPETDQDRLKALGAAAASSGAVALFHAVGITPEAPTLGVALHGGPPEELIEPTIAQLEATWRKLSTAPDGPLTAVALGSPHFSLAEFESLLPLVRSHPPHESVELVVCTNRWALDLIDERGWRDELERLGVRLVVDTCVVVTPILRGVEGVLMTNSGKFAHYTPGNINREVVFGSLEECVRSAASGRVERDDLWSMGGEG